MTGGFWMSRSPGKTAKLNPKNLSRVKIQLEFCWIVHFRFCSWTAINCYLFQVFLLCFETNQKNNSIFLVHFSPRRPRCGGCLQCLKTWDAANHQSWRSRLRWFTRFPLGFGGGWFSGGVSRRSFLIKVLSTKGGVWFYRCFRSFLDTVNFFLLNKMHM